MIRWFRPERKAVLRSPFNFYENFFTFDDPSSPCVCFSACSGCTHRWHAASNSNACHFENESGAKPSPSKRKKNTKKKKKKKKKTLLLVIMKFWALRRCTISPLSKLPVSISFYHSGIFLLLFLFRHLFRHTEKYSWRKEFKNSISKPRSEGRKICCARSFEVLFWTFDLLKNLT